MPTYAFGIRSNFKVEVSEEEAMKHNRFLEDVYLAKAGKGPSSRPWRPGQPIPITADLDDYRAFCRVIDALQKELDILQATNTPIVVTNDYLVEV